MILPLEDFNEIINKNFFYIIDCVNWLEKFHIKCKIYVLDFDELEKINHIDELYFYKRPHDLFHVIKVINLKSPNELLRIIKLKEFL